MSRKEIARAYISAVNNYDAATIERMVDENYIQHNPFVPTGRAAFLAFLPKLKESGSKIRNRQLFGDGPYVIMHHEWENAAPFGHDRAEAFHIIRIDERSLIAEHWSVMTKDSGAIADVHYQKQHKRFAERNLMLTVSEGIASGVPSAIYDLIRFENNKPADHRRIVQQIPSKNLANENTMFGFR